MTPLKTLCIFGTRPEAIKMAQLANLLGPRENAYGHKNVHRGHLTVKGEQR